MYSTCTLHVLSMYSTYIDQSAPNLVKMYNVCDHKILDEFNYGFNKSNQNCLSNLPLNLQKMLNVISSFTP